jgi:hypothetical protein
MSVSDTPYRIDLASILRAFPPGHDAPRLLLDFAAWLKGRPWAASVALAWSDNSPTSRRSTMAARCAATSLCFSDCRKDRWSAPGAEPALKWQDRRSSSSAPEGQNEILAASLEGLLAKIALGWFEENGARLMKISRRTRWTNLPIGSARVLP